MKKGKKLFFVGVAAAFIAFLWGLERGTNLLLASHLELESIEVHGCQRMDREQIVEAASVPPKTPIFKLDLREIARRVEALPWVRSCQVRRVLPDTLCLRVIERQPVALIRLEKRISGYLDPKLASHTRVANARDGILVLQADSPAWAARLRQQVPTLITRLRETGETGPVEQIRVTVRPADQTGPPPARPMARLSSRSAAEIEAAAEAIDDRALGSALKRLARHRR